MLSAYTGRSVSTLGNPNYVAGYLLIFVPLLIASSLVVIGKTKQRIDIQIVHILAILILLIAIYATGSYIAIVLIGLLGLWYILQYMFRDLARSRQIIVWIMLSICLVFIALSLIDPTKFLSLSSRFVLMRESLLMMTRDPISFLIGFGPDSILTYFSLDRSILVNSHFPANMSIDSSHNVFIDILFQYGILPILIIGYALSIIWKNQKEELKIAILLGGIFLALNVFVVAHIVVLCLLILISMRESNQ